MMAMIIRTEYESIKNSFQDPKVLLEKLNSIFVERYRNTKKFFSCVVLDIDLNEKQFYFSSAGHPVQIAVLNQELIKLPRQGYLMGLSKDAKYKTVTGHFKPGDRFFLFTDGIFEERNEKLEQFGEEEVHRILLNSRYETLSDSQEELLQKVKSFSKKESMEDDVTILGIEIQ